MASSESVSNEHINGCESNGDSGTPQCVKTTIQKKSPTNHLIGSLDSSNSLNGSNGSAKVLRTEEAELAAVIAKVTGRVSPFVNESADGQRKFTILCGDAVCHENDCDNITSSLSLSQKNNHDEKLSTGFDGIDSSKPVSVALSENGEIPEGVSLKKPLIECDLGLETNMVNGENNMVLNDNIDRKTHDDNANVIRDVQEDNFFAYGQQQCENNGHTDRVVRSTDCSSVTKSKTLTNGDDSTSKKGFKTNGHYDHKTAASSDITASEEEDLKSQKQVLEKEEQAEKLDVVVKDDRSEPQSTTTQKTDTVKACFPDAQPKVLAKYFAMNSPEMQQNIINRRMAARNATAIAEFDPLVTVSPEAEKLAMWTRLASTEKKTSESPGQDPGQVSHPTKSAETPEGNALSSTEEENSKETTTDITKDLRMQLLHQMVSEKKIAVIAEEELKKKKNNKREDEAKVKNNNKRTDSELCDEEVDKESPIYTQWVIPLMMLILIPAAILALVLLLNLTPFGSSDLARKIIGDADTLEDDNRDSSAKAFQELLKKLRKVKDMQGEFMDSNFMSESEDIFGSDFVPSGEDFYDDEDGGVDDGYQEHDEIHNDNDYDYSEGNEKPGINSRRKIKDRRDFYSLLAEENLHIFESHPRKYHVICSSFEDAEGETLCKKIKPNVLKLVLKYIKSCQKSGDIILTDYIRMYRYLNSFLSSFGGFAAIQTKMLEERVKQLEEMTFGEHALDYQHLFQMIYFEVASGRVDDVEPFSGTLILTCLHRHLQFLTLALENILTLNEGDSLQVAFETAYQKVLSSHHTWLVEWIYKVGMNMLPTKEQAVTLLGIRQVEDVDLEELMDSFRIIIEQFNSLIEVTEGILKQTDALEILPKQVIT